MASYEQGMEYFKQAMLDSEKTGFNRALAYFNESIVQDSNNISAYYWKMNCQVQLSEFDSALKTSTTALNVIGLKSHSLKPNFFVAKGMIEKRKGDEKAFVNNFSKAIKIFDERLTQDPKNIDSISNKAILLCSIEGKQSALDFISSVSVEKEWENSLIEIKNYISDFDFDSYMNGFFN